MPAIAIVLIVVLVVSAVALVGTPTLMLADLIVSAPPLLAVCLSLVSLVLAVGLMGWRIPPLARAAGVKSPRRPFLKIVSDVIAIYLVTGLIGALKLLDSGSNTPVYVAVLAGVLVSGRVFWQVRSSRRDLTGQMWWADIVRDDDGTLKNRPVVVLRSASQGRWLVAYLTSQDKSRYPAEYIHFPAGSLAGSTKDSWINVKSLHEVPRRQLTSPVSPGARRLPTEQFNLILAKTN